MSGSTLTAGFPEVRKAECSQCGGVRNCEVKGTHLVSYDDEQFSGRTYWRILECRGCENVFVQTVATNSEDYENFYEDDGSVGTRHSETFRYWPALSKRPRPEWMSYHGISDKDSPEVDALDKAMVELYGALDGDLRMLAGIGIRKAYDIASEILGIDPDLTFFEKMNALVTGNKITSLDRSRLETMIDAGSASAHRGWRPSPQDLNTMMNLLGPVENQGIPLTTVTVIQVPKGVCHGSVQPDGRSVGKDGALRLG